MPPPDVSIVILSWNTRDLTRACLAALRACAERSTLVLDVIVIDNASADDSVDMMRAEFPEVRLFRNETNLGYAKGVNQGLALARGRMTMLLGSDTEVRPGTIDEMVRFLDEYPEVGAVAPRLVYPDGRPQRSCMRFPDLKTALYYDTALEHFWPEAQVLRNYNYKDWDHTGSRPVDQPPGTCLLVRKEVVDQVGPMDRRLWLLFNDVDWCRRIRSAGWQIWYLHEGTEVAHHLGGSTRNLRSFPVEWHKNRLFYYRKHYHLMGTVLVKLALIYVVTREVVRIRRNLDDTREFFRHASQVVRAGLGVLFL
jgi:GT2 family glycosyltransferase